jgi:hypothetical protein
MNCNWLSNLKQFNLPLFFVIIALFFLLGNIANAQCTLLNESFDSNPSLSATNVDGSWYPDRYPPAAFESDAGRLKISISSADGAQSRPSGFGGSFYNTQGRKFNQCGKCVTVAKADLYIPSDWATNFRRSDIWATALNSSDAIVFYPILGFRNVDGSSPNLSFWNGTLGWVEMGPPPAYDTWYNLEMRLSGGNLEYLIDGSVVGVVALPTAVYFGEIIMQAYNFNDSALGASHDPGPNNSYDAFWDNLITSGPDGNTVTNVDSGILYCSIQSAINDPLTLNGHTLLVSPGTFSENVTVNKGLILNGANASLSPCTGSRGAESTIMGSFTIAANDISIDGFEFTGAGARIASSAGATTWSDISIQNNWLHATTAQQPILHGFGSGGGIGTTNWTVSNNKIEDIQSANSTAMALFNISNAAVDNNCISHTNAAFDGRRGINADGLQTATINGNTIDMGVINPLPDNSDGTFTKARYPLQLSSSNQGSNNVTVDGNIFTGAYDGIVTLGNGSYTTVTISNNEISNVVIGIRPQAGTNTPAGSHTNFSIQNNSIASSNWSIRLQSGALAPYTNITINNNSLLRSTPGIALEVQATAVITDAPINATCNWYGSSIAADVAARVSGNITYIPYLTSDGDGAGVGFQPTGTCAGQPDLDAPITSNVALSDDVIKVNENLTLTANVDDSTTRGSDIASAEYSYDGGATWYPMDAADGDFDSMSEDVTATFPAPASAGFYEVCVRGTDSAGNTSDESCVEFVVFDPNGGSVKKGDGRIESPYGALVNNPSAIGRADFDFKAEYKKNNHELKGKAKFKFKNGDLDFKEDNLHWLIINDDQDYAILRGDGEIKHRPGVVQFMIWGGEYDTGDTFRIRLWEQDGENEILIYDNLVDQVIDKGKIEIKPPKNSRPFEQTTEEELEVLNEIALWPNPSQNQFNIQLNNEDFVKATIDVYDFYGNVLEKSLEIQNKKCSTTLL